MKTTMPFASLSLSMTDRFFVGGEWVKPSTSATFDVIDPSTEESIFSVAEAQNADVDRAVTAARYAFDHGPWPRLTPQERAEYLRKLASGLEQLQHELSDIWTSETGVLNSIALARMSGLGEVFRKYASLGDTFKFVESAGPQGECAVGLIVREPAGVVGAIVPWNGAAFLIANKLAPALLAGCTVILKASPEAPGEAYVLAHVAQAVGLPPGVVNVVTADREVSEGLVRDARVDKITFTGSTVAGKRIAAICGERMARVTCELGGKSAALIFDDFDLEVAADALVGPACFLTGQVCASLTRIIVGRKRQDELVDALSERFARVRIGDPFDPNTDMGPLAMSRQRDRVEGYIAKGVQDGATLAFGGRRPPDLDRGFFIEPTIFANVDNTSTIAREEIFGPVLSVITAEDERHAIALANDTIYGLNNVIFTRDVARAYAVSRQLRSGSVGHNAVRSVSGGVFGGFKQSGIGREGGAEGLRSFLETKSIILDQVPADLGLLDSPSSCDRDVVD